MLLSLILLWALPSSGLMHKHVYQLDNTYGSMEGVNVSFSIDYSELKADRDTGNHPSFVMGSPKKHSFSVISIKGQGKKIDISDFFASIAVVDKGPGKNQDLGYGVTGAFREYQSNSIDNDDLKFTGLVSKNYKDPKSKKAMAAHVALTKVHAEGLQRFLASTSEYALVLEDGIKLSSHGQKSIKDGGLMAKLEQLIDAAPKDFHEINLGRCMSECFRQNVTKDLGSEDKLVEAQNQLCSHAYLLSREGARAAVALFNRPIRYNNFMMKAWLFDTREYKQYSITPRLFEKEDPTKVCNSKGCRSIGECGLADMVTQESCDFKAPCQASGDCYSLDVADTQAFNFSFKGFESTKVGSNLDKLRPMLRSKHFRIRANYKFMMGCGFFTFPYMVLNQLEFAVREGLIGDKAPFVYMPESHHYHSCINDTAKGGQSSADFWHKYFEPISSVDPKSVKDADVWELTQDSLMSSFYDKNATHAYPYPGDSEWECGNTWLDNNRKKATKIVKEYIHAKKSFLDMAKSKYSQLFNREVNKPILGLHMRGTDKFVHGRVDPESYIRLATEHVQLNGPNSRVFLATDDKNYLSDMKQEFPDVLGVLEANRQDANVLYNDSVSKDQKCQDVLMDSLMLAQTDSLVKCWSAVSEFGVYFRSGDFPELPAYGEITDLESADEKRKMLFADPNTYSLATSEGKCSNTDPLPDYGGGKLGDTTCCPHVNAEFAKEAEAKKLKIGKPKTGKGAFVILAQNKKHQTYGRPGMEILNNTLRLLFKHYNDREHDDVIVMHEGDFDAEAQKAVIAGRPEIKFHHLKGEDWKDPPAKVMESRKHWAGVEGMGYRKMMRLYAVRIWPMMKKLGYRWVSRFDDDSYLLSEIPYNLFGFMEHYGIGYGYRNIARETGLIWPKPDDYSAYLRNYSKKHMEGTTGWYLDLCESKESVDDLTRENCGEQFGFYNNFFVADIERFLQPDVQNFLNYVDESGKIFTNRWNDLILQSSTVQFFLNKNATFHFTGWTYGHNSGYHDMLHYGIVQVGRFVKEPWRAYQYYMEHELKWNIEMHKKYLHNVNGLLTLVNPSPGNCCANEEPAGWDNPESVLTPTQFLC